MLIGGTTVWDATYTMDALHRRITPVEEPEKRTRFIAFFGCSYTFGTGVNDNETLPFYVGRYAPGFMPYNYGGPGWGPQQMLLKLQEENLRGEISQPRGIGVYVYIDDHPRRAIGAMRIFWARRYPCYERQDGKLTYLGDFRLAHPWRTFLYDCLLKSNTVEFLHFDLPPRITEADIQLTADITKESAACFASQFNKDPFYVLIFPYQQPYGPRLLKYLTKDRVPYLDCIHLLDGADWQTLYADMHPTPRAYDAVEVKNPTSPCFSSSANLSTCS
jgi:hypothetical protein